jgi:hypothetical protein
VQCPCPGGGRGLQACSPDGLGFGACSFCGVPRDGFAEVAKDIGLPDDSSVCVGFADFDGDGKLDLVAGPAGFGLGIHKGNGDGTFSKQPAAKLSSGFAVACAIGDIDNDGDPDLVAHTTNMGQGVVELWRNQGGFKLDKDGGAVDSAIVAEPLLLAVGLWDYDQDGWLDVFIGRYFGGGMGSTKPDCRFTSAADFACFVPMGTHNPSPLVFHNEGGKLKQASSVLSAPFPGTTNAVAFADLNRDGRTDVFMSNDWYVDHVQQRAKDGSYSHVEQSLGIDQYNHGMGAAIADFDGDALLDVYGADLGPNNFWFGTKSGAMDNRALALGIAGATQYHSNWAPLAEDFDLDGRIDLFVASTGVVDNLPDLVKLGSASPVGKAIPQHDLVFWNESWGGFARQDLPHRPTHPATVSAGAAAVGDPDGDGDLDIVVSGGGAPGQLRFLRNQQKGGNYVVVALEGKSSNRDGVGAEVSLLANGKVSQLRIVGAQGSLGSSWRRAHFGLGAMQSVEEVRVLWPSGKQQSVTNVKGNQTIVVKEP